MLLQPSSSQQQARLLKNRKNLLSQIDTSSLASLNKAWNVGSPKNIPSPYTNVKGHVPTPSQTHSSVTTARREPTHPKKPNDMPSPTKVVQSTRTFSTQYPYSSNVREKSQEGLAPRQEPEYKQVYFPSGLELKKQARKQSRQAFVSLDGSDILKKEPSIGTINMVLSVQKQMSPDNKQDKIMKLLKSYVSPSSRVKKTAQHAHSISIGHNFSGVGDLYPEPQRSPTSSHAKKNTISLTTPVIQEVVPWKNLSKPVPAKLVLEQYLNCLSPFEREEIKEFAEIFYISDCHHKVLAKNEQDYDDDRGDYRLSKGDHIMYRYEVGELLGRGSFGQVVKAFDHKRKEFVAVKIIRSPKKFCYQAQIEIKLLDYMMNHGGAEYNITELKSHFFFRRHVCLVFDLMSLNLYDFLKENKFQGLHINVVRKIAIQVLYALKFLSKHRIIHCDLKPENILLKHPTRTGIRLIDFGSSCFENEKLYTYIQSRFYRSPEIILGISYTTQIDMWSFGCLLCELYAGYPLFAGESETDQLLSMMEVLGVPDKRLLANSPRARNFFSDDLEPIIVPNSKGKLRIPNTFPLASFIQCEDPRFIDLIRHCLVFDPRERYSADDALAHDWIMEDLPPELRTQHLKMISKIDQLSSPQGSGQKPKSRSEIVSPKNKDLSPKESVPVVNADLNTSATQKKLKIIKRNAMGSSLAPIASSEPQSSVEVQNEEFDTVTETTTNDTKSGSKKAKKESLNVSTNQEIPVVQLSSSPMSAQPYQTTQNFMANLTQETAKGGAKYFYFPASSRTKPSTQIKVSSGKQMPYSAKHSYQANMVSNTEISVEEAGSKDRSLKESRIIMEAKNNLADHSQIYSQRSWRIPKSTEAQRKPSIETSKGVILITKKGAASPDWKPQKIRQISLN